jgi:hypothetical protein
LRSWDIVVGIVRSHAKAKQLGAHPGFCSNISDHSFLRVKWPVREFDQQHPPGEEVRKERNCRMYGVILTPSWK